MLFKRWRWRIGLNGSGDTGKSLDFDGTCTLKLLNQLYFVILGMGCQHGIQTSGDLPSS